jgi:replicative DNA helicase
MSDESLTVALSIASWGYSVEAEQSVLGGLLLDNSALDRVADVLRESDFFTLDHRAMFRCISSQIEAGKPADVVTIAERLFLEAPRELEAMGGAAYLGKLAQNTPSALHIRRYAELVRERAVRRGLFQVGQSISEAAIRSRGRDAGQLTDEAERLVMQIGSQRTPGRADFKDMRQVLAAAFEFVDEQHTRFSNAPNEDWVPGLTTGFRDLDKQTGGMHGGQLILLAARPSMGKSTLALNISEHAARASNRWVQFFTIEMGAREQGMRVLAANAKINLQRMFSGRVYEQEWPRVSTAMSALVDLKVAFNEQASLTVGELRALARRGHREMGPPCLIVVDYLQLMVAGESESNRANQLAEISRGLKLLAKELDVPVIALSQLNRELEKRVNKRPVMSDLRDSGALEQDADAILFIYRDEVYHPNNTTERGVAELIIAKQRNGPVCTVRLGFRADHTRFSNYSDEPAQGPDE